MAATVARASARSWTVDDGDGGWRPARLGDITVLVPARTSLPFLEDALETGGIAYRAESSSLVYATRAVRDLLMVLRAVDDPTDYLAHRLRPAHPAAGLRRRRPVPLQGRAQRQVELPGRPARHRPPDDPVRTGLRLPALAVRPAPLARPLRSCWIASPATGGPSSWGSPKAGPATSGAGCAS